MTSQDLSLDTAILRRFEPVICYTRGEHYFPIDIERYIQQCSLWVQRSDQPAELLVPQGELTVEKLTEPRLDGFGTVYFLKFIEPLDAIELARYSINQAVKSLTQRDDEDVFRAGRGRLARVGFSSRLIDALFSITLYLRGRVPGDTAAAAALTYQRMQANDERYCYYGRVVRENGWVVLQYWFFYPFNNWRSGFFGVNDHEGDWEMVTLYCDEADAEPDQPSDCRLRLQWIAYASHDFSGDDLRRRWDDPEVKKLTDTQGGIHPVIYAGAGSHASYFAPGEYLSELELPFLSPLVRLVDKVQDIWRTMLHQGGDKTGKTEFNIFRVPFVDYARGDGIGIGPGQKRNWEALALDDQTTWASNYRGLWGLYARDPIAGENAPAGPVYNRDGSVRRSWYDPLGWAGLDKVPPPEQALEFLQRQRQQAYEQLEALEQLIDSKSAELYGLGIEADALEGAAHLERTHVAQHARITSLSRELNDLRRQQTVEQAKLQAFELHEQRLLQGNQGALRAHIHHSQQPSSDVDLRLGRLAEGFSAVSIGLVMVGIVGLIAFARHYLLIGLAIMIGLLIFIEAGFRRRLTNLISSMVLGLAIVSAFILLFQFFWQIVVVSVLAIGLYLITENLREIWG